MTPDPKPAAAHGDAPRGDAARAPACGGHLPGRRRPDAALSDVSPFGSGGASPRSLDRPGVLMSSAPADVLAAAAVAGAGACLPKAALTAAMIALAAGRDHTRSPTCSR